MLKFTKSLFLVFVVLFFSCDKNKNNYENVIVLGHGGMGEKSLKYPISSKESVQECLKTEANGSEVDVQITKDSLLVCFHNDKLSSNTKCNLEYIYDYNWTDIDNCTYKPFNGKQKQVALLKDVLNINTKSKKTISLDCKLYSASNPNFTFIFERAVSNFISEHKNRFDFYVESNDIELLKNVKIKHPDVKCFFLIQVKNFLAIDTMRMYSIDGYSVSVNDITKAEAQEAKNKGLLLMFWSCDSKNKNKLALELGADIIQTDELNHLIREQRN